VVAAVPKNSVVLENVHSVGNTYGIAVAAGNNVVISRSVMSEIFCACADPTCDPGNRAGLLSRLRPNLAVGPPAGRLMKTSQAGQACAMMGCPDAGRCPSTNGDTNMKKIARSLAVLAAILLPALPAAPAHAGFVHTWVSHSGNDGNTCQLASPCATITQALSQTADSGEISCLDTGAFGQYIVQISVTIDCSGTVATPDTAFGLGCNSAIVVNAPGKVVILRGLNVTGLFLCAAAGIVIQAATAVYIEDCVIENWSHQGIVDQRTTGLTRLAIKNTIVRNNWSAGIVAGAAPRNSVVLENVYSVGNTYGIGVATGNNVVISRSVMSENSIAGIEADPGADVVVENTKISHNASYGIFAQGTVTLANSDISFNTSSIAGSTFSFGNNRMVGNGGGDAPTLISQQ
jgi:hypothetical protein